ncbi:MAG: DUF488 domain-containing protein [Archangium sp.]|nr:DUF488 domain-containing protein [Archangium sp.]MDP3574711.1 DUF488 domain-containing protein [Archangium sp.]
MPAYLLSGLPVSRGCDLPLGMARAATHEPKQVPLYPRQLRLLQLLRAFGGALGKVDLQKLLFLYCQESSSPPYTFVPYRFGAFSFTSYADLRKLIELGLVVDEDGWVLTPKAEKTIATEDVEFMAFARKYSELRGDPLVALTYRRYPYFATRSEISDRVLAGDMPALKAITAAKPLTTQTRIFTVGYEGQTVDSFLNALIVSAVDVLCDVRRNPISRKPGFSKSTLANSCRNVGIAYEHIPELGIDSSKRRTLETQADYDALFADYERDWLPEQKPALRRLRELSNGGRVALMCFERDPQQCHRHCVAEILETEFGTNYAPRHL